MRRTILTLSLWRSHFTRPHLLLPVLVLGLGACGANTAPGPETAQAPGDGAGASGTSADAPARTPSGPRPADFELETLGGDSVRLADHLGKDVVLIDFWATFCDPCLTAMPHLEQLYQKHKGDGFVVLGISIDGPDSVAQVRTEVSKLGVTFPILLDQETRVVALYNPKTSAPYSVLIGRDGTVLTKREGYTTSGGAQLDEDVARAVAAR